MPLPILHSFTGYSIYHLTRKKNEDSHWGLILLAVLLANLADFDFLPGIHAGQALRFHRGITHTLGAALLCGALLAFIGRALTTASFIQTFVRAVAAYYSHIVLDFVAGAPEGLRLFWPFTGTRFYSSYLLLPTHAHVDFGATTFGEFLGAFFSPACFNALFLELTLVFSVWALATAWRNFREKIGIQEPEVLVRGGLAVASWISFMLTRGMG